MPLIQHAPRCKSQQSIAGLAQALGDKNGQVPQPTTKPASGGSLLSSLFGGGKKK